MADYATSSQRQRWMFTTQYLRERRRDCNLKSVENLKKYGTTDRDAREETVQNKEGGNSPDEKPPKPNGMTLNKPLDLEKGDKLPPPLKPEEENLLRKFYEVKLRQVCEAFQFPLKVQTTAVLYFKRFYLEYSVMDYDPKHVMLTCIYLSCKVEENHVSADEFGKGINQDPAAVLKHEVVVLQALDFNLIVFAPFRALEGFLHDLQDQQPEIPDEELQELKTSSFTMINNLMLTDACFIYPPGQLALAALRTAAAAAQTIDVTSYTRSLLERVFSELTYEDLCKVLDEILSLVEAAGPLPVEADVRDIDRKLKYCRNPALYREHKQKRKERERQGKASQKRASHDVHGTNPNELGAAEFEERKRRRSEPHGQGAA